MSGDPTGTAAGPWSEQDPLRPPLLHYRSADVLPSFFHSLHSPSDTSSMDSQAAVRPPLRHSPSAVFSRHSRSFHRVSQGARVHRTDPELSRQDSKSILAGSLEPLTMSPGPMTHTRQHPYVRPPSRANSRDTGTLPIMQERPHPMVFLDDWASCSSEGLPSLPTSPGWARAEEQARSLARRASHSISSESIQRPIQTPSRSHSLDEYGGASPVHARPQTRSKTAQALIPTSSLNSDHAMSTLQMIQQLNLETRFDSSAPFSHDPSPITTSPESSPRATSRHNAFGGVKELNNPQAMSLRPSQPSSPSLDMDLSVEGLMESDVNHSGMLSSYTSERETPSIDLLSVGDHVGPGLYHDGELIRIAQTCDGLDAHDPTYKAKPLEVVRLLGQGSYAVVYLVREVPSPDSTPSPPLNMDASASSTPHGLDQSHPFSPGKTPRQGDLVWPRGTPEPKTEGVAHYALKCLSKRHLTPEQAFTQRNELTIHQSIPAHPNIITLHSAYETTDWLFLVLEYCPGKDLYFWLEEAQDTLDLLTSNSTSDPLSLSRSSPEFSAQESISMEMNTSSTPWLLTTTSPGALLSERRLQLVSDIFQQMCKAVQFCHDLGISHRDIKPENFIVEDRRGQSSELDDQIIVKLTDFGLATSAEFSCDFNCGSKPYMAFECRHDLSSHYDPKQSDIWSLGVVLLNLLFHRSPFQDASAKHCASFAAFSYKPILFLMQAFDGLTEEMAHFLNDNVFCDVSRGRRRRIAPHAFGQWVKGLPQMLGKTDQASRGTSSSSCMPLRLSHVPGAVPAQGYGSPEPVSPGMVSIQGSRMHLSGNVSANDSLGGVSSFPDPSSDMLPRGTMSGSMSLSRSSAPFPNARP